MRFRWLWPALIVLIVLGILAPVSPLYRPVPSDDPSVFLYTAQRLLEGDAPYRAAWDHKQPLAYWVYALALLLTPHSLWGMWIIELAGLAAAGLLGFLLLRRVAPRPIAFLAVAAGLLTLSVILWTYSLEELALPLQIFCLYAFARLQTETGARQQVLLGLSAGAAVGAAFFLKQSLIAAGLAVGIYLVLEMLLRRSWRDLIPLGGMALGFAIVALPLLAHLGLNGALADYRDAVFTFNLSYAGLGPVERVEAVLDALEFLSSVPGLFLAFALWGGTAGLGVMQSGPWLARLLCGRAFRPVTLSAGAGLAALSLIAEAVGREPGFGLVQWLALAGGAVLLLTGLLAGNARLRSRLSGWLAGAPVLPETDRDLSGQQKTQRALLWLAALYFPILLGLVTLSGRNYVYYFIPFVPFLMLALGLAGGLLWQSAGQGAPRRLAGMLLIGLGAALAYNPLLLILNGLAAPANPPLPEIAAYVQANTSLDETILAWGKETTYVYFLTNRRAPTRYFYQAAVTQENYNNALGVSDEILRNLQAAPPRLFLLYTNSSEPPPAGVCPLPAGDEPNSVGRIFSFVCDHYRYETTIDEFQVFTRTP